MENASRALIITAGVLIGILVLSLAAYLYFVFGDYVANTHELIAINTLAQFNDKYLQYNNRTDLTIQDIVTVKNYALENNYSYSDYNINSTIAADNNNFIDVFKGENRTVQNRILNIPDEQLLQEELNNGGQRKFTCEVTISQQTRRVNKIYFYPTT